VTGWGQDAHRFERRKFFGGLGFLSMGIVSGAAGGYAAEPMLNREGPTARTARPAGPGRYVTETMFRTDPVDRVVALTIDDGPTAEWTPQVLRVLARRQAVATFFRVGMRAQALPRLIQQTASAGHEQANHTWEHSDLTQNSGSFDRDSLQRTHDLLTKLTGVQPTSCRPPYGRVDSVGLAVCAAMNYGVILWSQHITGSNAVADTGAALRQASPGSIVLAHDGGSEPNASLMQQLDRLVGSLQDDGFRFVTVSQLLAEERSPSDRHQPTTARVPLH